MKNSKLYVLPIGKVVAGVLLVAFIKLSLTKVLQIPSGIFKLDFFSHGTGLWTGHWITLSEKKLLRSVQSTGSTS